MKTKRKSSRKKMDCLVRLYKAVKARSDFYRYRSTKLSAFELLKNDVALDLEIEKALSEISKLPADKGK